MATFNKFNSFVEALAHGVHNLSSDSLMVALTNVAPTAANSQLVDITEIAYTNLSSRALTRTSSGQTAGTYGLVLVDLELVASGAVPEFRYVVIYNDTPVGDPLIGWYDRGSGLILASGESVTLRFIESQQLFTLT